MKTDRELMEEQVKRYLRATHAVQSGIAMAKDKSDQTPKHLRVGVDTTKVEQAGLAKLLIAKGLFTELEYVTAVADAMEEEVRRRESDLSLSYGTQVRLA